MSDEELATAEAALIAKYRVLNRKSVVLNATLTGWKNDFARLAAAIAVLSPKLVSESSYPPHGELLKTLTDYAGICNEMEQLRQELHRLGIPVS